MYPPNILRHDRDHPSVEHFRFGSFASFAPRPPHVRSEDNCGHATSSLIVSHWRNSTDAMLPHKSAHGPSRAAGLLTITAIFAIKVSFSREH
jgi:hypothetical protein